jgi:hypothetical protein
MTCSMEKMWDEGAGRHDVPQYVSGSNLWPSSRGTHLRAQRSTDRRSSQMTVVQQKSRPKAASSSTIAAQAIEIRQQL